MSFPRYPAYKPSGVEWLGEVPEHWEVVRLKQLCNVSPSNVDKKSVEGEASIHLCNYTDVYYNDYVTHEIAFMAATATEEQIEKFGLKAGDTIITKDSETADDIAIAAFVPKDLPGVVCGYHLSIVRPKTAVIGSFVKRLFDSVYTKSLMAVRANGLTRVGLSQYAIDNVELPLPPKEDQTHIVAFLDRETAKIDALIAEQQRLIELLQEKRQAVISHAVTKGLNPHAPMKDSGVEWLGEVPEHWSIQRIKHLCVSIEQGWSPQCENEPSDGDSPGVLKVGCVNGGIFRPSENKKLPPDLNPIPQYSVRSGDLLVSRANTKELVGSAAVVSEEFPWLYICDKIYRITVSPDKTAANYLALYLASNEVRGQIELGASGASQSMQNISQSVLMDLPIPVPQLKEQECIRNAIAIQCRQIDELTAKAREAIGLFQERRSALISAAVTGQIDVRGLVPEAEAA
jgi:type I restriction enzyme S subunit